jgi:hypothetical protein
VFGGIGARVAQQLGSGMERAGTIALDIATQQNELQNKVHAADVKSWYANQTTDLHTKFTALSGRGGRMRCRTTSRSYPISAPRRSAKSTRRK